jgi:signal transduction histidine kinase
MCHLGLLGRAKAQGYVVVMNDISELKELDRLKNQMIRMTSHDLKNPLSAAMMNTELLLEEGGDALNEDLRHYATTIMVQLERMSRITRGILDMERIQSGTPIVEDCDAAELLKMTVHEFDSYATRNDVTISAVLPTDIPLFPADRTYLTRALANLAENAIKFTRRGGSVVLGAEQANGQVIFHVADTGVGIPAEAQSRIFDRFFRVTQPGMEQVSGTGLGLSLVKSVADIHHGHVWFESAVGQGTTFHLALPLRPMLPTEWRRAIE